MELVKTSEAEKMAEILEKQFRHFTALGPKRSQTSP